MTLALLQAVGAAEVQAGWGGLQLAASGIGLSLLTALGAFAVDYLRGKRALTAKDLELKQNQLELQRLEVDEKISGIRKRIALDAAAIVEEQSRGGSLSGSAKAQLAAAKVEELLNESAAPNVEGSKLNDLVKLGVSQLRHNATTYLISQSMAPPPERHVVPDRLPPPAAMPAISSPATKTSPERPSSRR